MCTLQRTIPVWDSFHLRPDFFRLLDFVQFPYWGRLKLRSPTIHCGAGLMCWIAWFVSRPQFAKLPRWEWTTSYLRCNPSLLDMSSFVRCLLAVSAVRGPKSSKSTKVRIIHKFWKPDKNYETYTHNIHYQNVPEAIATCSMIAPQNTPNVWYWSLFTIYIYRWHFPPASLRLYPLVGDVEDSDYAKGDIFKVQSRRSQAFMKSAEIVELPCHLWR